MLGLLVVCRGVCLDVNITQLACAACAEYHRAGECTDAWATRPWVYRRLRASGNTMGPLFEATTKALPARSHGIKGGQASDRIDTPGTSQKSH